MKTTHRTASHAKRRYRADPSSIYRVMSRLQPFTPDELLKLELPIRMAFEAIKTGRGTLQDISEIDAAINATMVRAEKLDPLCRQTAMVSRDALLRCLHRYNATGRVGFDGPAIAEVELGIDLYEQLLRLSTPLQIADALREVLRRTSNKETLQ